ncbi:hypothetical protein PybrP1_012675 [[Pythium] brassicae (nom. inval.)]|nr:hypothetical protein PybrP1_012675 [[Pythium] brassicae (nom. inval.)]
MQRINGDRQTPAAAAATVVTTQAAPAVDAAEAPVYHVQLQPRARVRFDASTVDNEHLGRKKSNKCCIFHKKRAFGESSSESGEDSSDSEDGGDGARPSQRHSRRRQHRHDHTCDHSDHAGDAAAAAE